MTEPAQILTIGHSNHSWDRFLELVRSGGVDLLVDVRSSPISRYTPHFSQRQMETALTATGIGYRFLGTELGGRPSDGGLFTSGVADYELMARTADFARGIQTVIEWAGCHRLALMCAEKDPFDCHRCLLVGRKLQESGVGVLHVLSDGRVTPQSTIEDRLLAAAGLEAEDMFNSRRSRIALAYRERGQKVGYSLR